MACAWYGHLECSDVLHSDSALVLGACHAEAALGHMQQARHEAQCVRAVHVLLVQHKAAELVGCIRGPPILCASAPAAAACAALIAFPLVPLQMVRPGSEDCPCSTCTAQCGRTNRASLSATCCPRCYFSVATTAAFIPPLLVSLQMTKKEMALWSLFKPQAHMDR